MRVLKADLAEVESQKEIIWKQRSRVDFLHEGDHNTKFFHSYASNRRKRNQLDHIRDDSGAWVDEPSQVAQVANDYFTKLFTSSNPPLQDDVSGLVQMKVSEEDQIWLASPYSEEEIFSALQDMNPQKATGPDGLTAQFYQKFWEDVKSSVLQFCLDVLNNGASIQEENCTFITLIPKVTNADSMKKLRPISLCNIVYKIML